MEPFEPTPQRDPVTPADFAVRDMDAATEAMPGVSAMISQRGDRVVEIDDISATPMKQGLGTRALAVICQIADQYGVRLVARVANESDDFQAYDEDDESRPPSEDELVDWYGRFGFEVVSSGFEIVIARPARESGAKDIG